MARGPDGDQEYACARLRLVNALAMDQSEGWPAGPRHLTLAQTETVEESEKEGVLKPVA